MQYAPRLQRLLGQILDGFVALAPIVAASIVGAVSDALSAVLTTAGIVWAIGYLFLADGLPGGQSLGKRWLGMAVLDAETGRPCSFGQSLVRNLLLTILGPLDWIFIFGERHQRLGDKLANTIVRVA
jgi:uncharacterized RDD family membrane protein YckC